MSYGVNIEIDLGKISNSDLLEELSKRNIGEPAIEYIDTDELLDLLNIIECPKEIIEQFENWLKNHLLMKKNLKHGKNSARKHK